MTKFQKLIFTGGPLLSRGRQAASENVTEPWAVVEESRVPGEESH